MSSNPQPRERGKPRRRTDLNRHLFLREGNWWTRFCASGRDEKRTTGCPAAEIAAAREIRDKRKAESAQRREGIDRLPEALSVGELLAMYLREESGDYDREKGGEQPGTKRSAETDRGSAKRLRRHLNVNASAAAVDAETLLDLADAMEREEPTPAAATRKKTMALLRRAFSWGAERPRRSGFRLSPFATLTKAQRRKLLPKGGKRAYIYSPEQLRALYALLPPVSVRVVRFAVYTAMRLREILRLKWGAVDLEGGKLVVIAANAKNGQEREVALGAVALGILTALRPENPNPEAHVFLGETGEPVKTVYSGFVAKVEKVWKPERPGQARPRFHDLRKTAATRVEAVSSHAVAKAFLGHADTDVTDSYIVATLDAVRDAVNRAARSIDGEAPEGAIPFRSRVEKASGTPRQTEQQAVSQVAEQ